MDVPSDGLQHAHWYIHDAADGAISANGDAWCKITADRGWQVVADVRRATSVPERRRSMSFCDTRVAPRDSNVPATGFRSHTGAETFECEDMDSCYIDIDGFWPKDADTKGLESAPIADK